MRRFTPRKFISDNQLTANQRSQLEYGRQIFPGISRPLDDIALRELWEVHGDEVTADYIRRWPGQRPLYWWLTQGLDKPQNESAYLAENDLLEDSELETVE